MKKVDFRFIEKQICKKIGLSVKSPRPVRDYYEFVAARLGLTREQAKKEVYRKLYGG